MSETPETPGRRPPFGPVSLRSAALGSLLACLALGAPGVSPAVQAQTARAQAAQGDARVDADTVAAGGGAAWTSLARGAAVAGAFLVSDRAVRQVARAAQGSAADEVARRAKWLGTWRSSVPYYLAGTLVVSVAAEGTDGLATAAAVVAGALAGSTANELVNVPTGRHRPREERGSLAFSPLRGHSSFPSGHTAFTFALAGAIDEVTEASWPAVLAYGAAGMTGLSRIYHDGHWFSDVVVGAAVGALVSRATTRAVRERLRPGEVVTGKPVLTAGPGWVGVELRF